MPENILILSPHTDDAELGAGGTIIKFIEEKKNILWVVFSTAEESLPSGLPPDILAFEFKEVMNKLGLNNNNFNIHHFKVRYLCDSRQKILEELITIREAFQPDLVIGPSLHDFHQDHSVIANEMVRAFKTTASIICYELPWNHISFETQFFSKLQKNHIDRKVDVLKSYRSQFEKKRHYFSEEFVRGLASTRGAQVETDYAEAFEVIRWVY